MNFKEVMKDTAKLMLYYAIFFFLATAAGYYSYSLVEKEFMSMFQSLTSQIYVPSSMFQTALNIFLNNLFVSLLVFLTGFTLIFPILVVGLNGFLVGVVAHFALVERAVGLEIFLKAVLTHSVFELPAIFMASALGTRIGIEFYRLLHEIFLTIYVKEHELDRRRISLLLQRIREGISLFILIIFPLLLIAAFLEVYVSGQAVGLH